MDNFTSRFLAVRLAELIFTEYASFSAALLLYCYMLGEFGIPCVCGVAIVFRSAPPYYTRYLSPHCLLSHARQIWHTCHWAPVVAPLVFTGKVVEITPVYMRG